MLSVEQKRDIVIASQSYAREGRAPKQNLLCPERFPSELMLSLSSEDVFFLLERFCWVEKTYATDNRLYLKKDPFLGHFPYFYTLLRQHVEKDSKLKEKVSHLFLTTCFSLETREFDESVYCQPKGRLKTTIRAIGLDY